MSNVKQTYLIGPNLRLRAVEEADAATEPSWRNSWFPRAQAVAEAKIAEDFGDWEARRCWPSAPVTMSWSVRSHHGWTAPLPLSPRFRRAG